MDDVIGSARHDGETGSDYGADQWVTFFDVSTTAEWLEIAFAFLGGQGSTPIIESPPPRRSPRPIGDAIAGPHGSLALRA